MYIAIIRGGIGRLCIALEAAKRDIREIVFEKKLTSDFKRPLNFLYSEYKLINTV